MKPGTRRSIAACAACLFALHAHAEGVPVSDGAINVGTNAEIRSTNPGVNRDTNTDAVLMHMVEGLVAYREDGTVGPMLADKIDVSRDLKTYTFTLRPNVHFHNGALLTSGDVVWSWKRYLDPKTQWLCRTEFDGSKGFKIESVEADGPATVVFRLNRPRPLFLSEMAAFQCGASAILHRDSVNSDGSWRAPVGTGPYRFSRWIRGQVVELRAFRNYASRGGPADGYTGGKVAYAPLIRWILIKDEGSRRAALLKGQVDILPGVTPDQLVEMGSPRGIRVVSAPSMAVNVLLMQTRDPVLANPLLRQALAHSLDMRAIVKYGSGEAGVANPSMVPVPSAYHSAAHQQGYGFDLALARKLVARSGYKGEPISMLTNRRYPDMYDQAIMIQGMAKKAGINIQLEVLEWATQLDRFQTGKYQLMSFAYSSRPDPFLSYEGIIGDKNRSKRKVWDDPKAIALLERAAASANPGERQYLFDQLHRQMLADTPLVVLFNPGDSYALRASVRGFVPWSQNRERLWGVQLKTP